VPPPVCAPFDLIRDDDARGEGRASGVAAEEELGVAVAVVIAAAGDRLVVRGDGGGRRPWQKWVNVE
jgi:hypothetical protein